MVPCEVPAVTLLGPPGPHGLLTPATTSQEALVCMFLEAASIALTLAMRSCARADTGFP